jgi:hypothetical protein
VSSLLNPAQTETLNVLRGDPGARPTITPALRTDLQAFIDAELAEVDGPLTISKWMLSNVHDCEGRYLAKDEFSWKPSNARGTVVHKALELSTGGRNSVPPMTLVDHAMRRLCEAPDTQSLAEYLRTIDDGERAELRVAATDLVMKFFEMFPPLRDAWHPNAEASTAAFAGHRRIIFRGKIDLRLGTLHHERASTLILDFKTGNPSFADREDLRFYALLETLRTGVPPFRWANLYLSAGRTEHEDFSEGALHAAARRLVDGTRKIAALHAGAQPSLSPGPTCTFCPARHDCEAATAISSTIDPDDMDALAS